MDEEEVVVNGAFGANAVKDAAATVDGLVDVLAKE